MKRTILQQYNIKELDPGTIVHSIFSIVGSDRLHEIFKYYVELKDWEEIYLKDGKEDGMD